jgi:hypothetical protein
MILCVGLAVLAVLAVLGVACREIIRDSAAGVSQAADPSSGQKSRDYFPLVRGSRVW